VGPTCLTVEEKRHLDRTRKLKGKTPFGPTGLNGEVAAYEARQAGSGELDWLGWFPGKVSKLKLILNFK
jgi:hypothetical protein